MSNINDERINALTEYCRETLDFGTIKQPDYQSISVCLIDCVFSLRAKYLKTVIPVVERYAEKYLNGDKYAAGDTLSSLLKRIEEAGGPDQFAETVLCNSQRISERLKTDVCKEIAEKLLNWLGIDTLDDFKKLFGEKPDLLEVVLRSVKGFGDAGVNYLFMLAGDENRCKPDVHIHQCIKDALHTDVSNTDCQLLIQRASERLKAEFPDMTTRKLDFLIWNKYQSEQQS